LANAVAATQIYEARGGPPQKIQADLRKGHNYIDPDTGMTPTINGQVGHYRDISLSGNITDNLINRRSLWTSWPATLSSTAFTKPKISDM
jgi:hypothetical protein